MPAPTYYLHPGLPKTGTTLLQSALADHREALAEDGVLYPTFAPYARFYAALDGRDRQTYRGRTFETEGAWSDFVARTKDYDGKVLFSHELLGAPAADQVPTALRELEDYEVHVVVTARDPARQLPSCWQQHLRHNKTISFDEYLRDVYTGGSSTGRRFRDQHVDRMLEAWAAYVPANRLHLVTLPPVGADPTVLWTRFCGLLGVDASRFPLSDEMDSNTSLGVAQIEHLRRVNAAIGNRLGHSDHPRIVRRLFTRRMLSQTSRSPRPALPDSARPMAEHIAENWISAIEREGYDVIGDVEDLRPAATPGVDPDMWQPEDVMTVGAEATADLLVAYAELERKLKSRRDRSDTAAEARPSSRLG